MLSRVTTPLILLLILGFQSCSHHPGRLPADQKKVKYGPQVRPLSLENDSLKDAKSFWKIIPYYRGQKTESSCSVASVTMIINALIPSYSLPADARIFTEKSILELSRSLRWQNATSSDGSGMILLHVQEEIKSLFSRLGLSRDYKISGHHMADEKDKIFREALESMNKDGTWIILNYDQGMVMNNGSYGHYSPIAAYDAVKDRVLILDTDADWYEPYWVPVETIVKSMKTFDSDAHANRGFLLIKRLSK